MSEKYIVKKTDRVLVTGANGYLGLKVIEILLEYGFNRLSLLIRSDKNIDKLKKVIDKDENQIQIFNGNLLSVKDCEAAVKGVSVIYHLAAGVEKSFAGCFLNSVVTTRNLLDAAIKNNKMKRFINISSIAVYTNKGLGWGDILDETCRVDDQFVERYEAYAYGKAKQDEIVMEYGNKYRLPYVIIRPGVIFGPGKAKISDRIGTDTFGIFLHLGLGNQIPLIYLDNCAELVILAGLMPDIQNQVFNAIDDDLPSSRKFLGKYKKYVGWFFSFPVPYTFWYFFNFIWEKYSKWSQGQLPPVFNRKTCSVYWKPIKYTNQKAKEILGWAPRINMKEALSNFFSYMREMNK